VNTSASGRSSVSRERPIIGRQAATWLLASLILCVMLEALGLLSPLEYRAYDLRARLKARRPAAVAPDLAIVTIDARSEEALGPFPWPHQVYSALVSRLEFLGAKGVMFAIQFTREDPTDDALTPGVPLFIVRPYAFTDTASSRKPPQVGEWQRVPTEMAAGDPVTSFSAIVLSREDGVYRHAQEKAIDRVTGGPVYGLELLLASRARGVPPEQLARHLDDRGRLLLSSEMPALPALSFVDVLSENATSVRKTVEDRWVLVGVDDSPTVPSLPSPFGRLNALEARAVATNSLLVDESNRPLTPLTSIFAIVLWAALSATAVFGIRASALTSRRVLVLGGAAVAGHVLVAVAAFEIWRVWIPIVAPVAVIGLSALVWAFALDAARLEAAHLRAVASEREAAFGVMAAQVRHEVRNVLQSIRAPADIVRRNFERGDPLGMASNPDAICSEMDTIIRRTQRLSDMVDNDLAYFGGGPPETMPGDAWEVAAEVADSMEPELAEQGVSTRRIAPQDRALADIDGATMRVVFTNLIRNAMQAMPEGGILTLAYAEPTAGTVAIRVTDTGVGIEADRLAHVFDAFHTTKARGLGLGLLNARNIVTAHRGDIRVESRIGAGTTFEVVLPRARAATQS